MKIEVDIIQGVNASVENRTLSVSGAKGPIVKEFKTPYVDMKIEDSKIFLETCDEKRKTIAQAKAMERIIQNILKGVDKGYTYKLAIVYSHFPMTVVLKGSEVHINNFVGEKKTRIVKVPNNVQVKIKGRDIEVTSPDKEIAGCIAGLIEKTVVVKGRDRRVYQDGIYITQKAELGE